MQQQQQQQPPRGYIIQSAPLRQGLPVQGYQSTQFQGFVTSRPPQQMQMPQMNAAMSPPSGAPPGMLHSAPSPYQTVMRASTPTPSPQNPSSLISRPSSSASYAATPSPTPSGNYQVPNMVIPSISNQGGMQMSQPMTSGYQGQQSSVQRSTNSQMLSKQRLDDLVREVDINEQLDEDVKDVLLQFADEFIESVVGSGCDLAKHRNSDRLDVKDVQMVLERNYNMTIPGFGGDAPRQFKKGVVTDAHKQRMGLIKKTLKKL